MWLGEQQQQAHCWSTSISPLAEFRVSERAETSISQEPPGCPAEMGAGLGAYARRRTPEETGMPWRLHSWPEAHAGLVVSKAPAKGRC